MQAKLVSESIKHLTGRTPEELKKLQQKYVEYVISLGDLAWKIQGYFDHTKYTVDVESQWKDGKKIIEITSLDFEDYHEIYIDHDLESRFNFDADIEGIEGGIRYIILMPDEDEELDESIKHLKPRDQKEIEESLPKNVIILKNYLNNKNIPYKLEAESEHTCDFYFGDYIIAYHSVEKNFWIWQKYEKHIDVISTHTSLEKVMNFIETGKINESIWI